MKTISLKIDENILGETDKIISNTNKSRNKYISEALDSYNKKQKRTILKDQIQKESHLVKDESITVLAEFEKLDQ